MATASSWLSTSTRKYPPMASFDSANGPSATTRPFFPETTLPSFTKGFPPLTFPWVVSSSNQLLNRTSTSWISCGESPWCQSVPRNINRYSFLFSLLIIGYVDQFFARSSIMTNEQPPSGQSTLIFFRGGPGFAEYWSGPLPGLSASNLRHPAAPPPLETRAGLPPFARLPSHRRANRY